MDLARALVSSPRRSDLGLVLLAVGGALGCAAPYSLAHPTPRAEMQELSTDRPDMTESPLSVDPGHVQVEFDAVAFETERTLAGRTRELRVPGINARLGVGMRTDVQLVFTPFVARSYVPLDEQRANVMGFGDTTLRLKVNLRGNHEEGFAIGLLPFVLVPTATGGVGEGGFVGGLGVPMGLSLGARVDLGMQVQLEMSGGRTSQVAWRSLGTVTVSFAIVGPFAIFVETAQATVFDGTATPTLEAHGGFTLDVNDNLRLDGGFFGTVVGAGHPMVAFVGGTIRR